MLKGADVFRNLGCDGKSDLVITFNSHAFKVDVKLWTSTPRGTVTPVDVYPVVVVARDPSDIASWIVRWRGKTKANITTDHFKPNCPPGLENFWD